MSGLVKPSLGAARRPPPDPWVAAAAAVRSWLETGARADALLEGLPAWPEGPGRARCQHLVLGAIRHSGRVGAALGRLVARPARPRVQAALLVAGFELIEAAGDAGGTAKVVHHAVGRVRELASPAEARLANAVLRKLAGTLAAPPPPEDAAPAELAEHFSHPEWLVRRWLGAFGPAATRALLDWNQRPAPVYARWRGSAEAVPSWLRPTRWPGFHEVEPGRWPAVEQAARDGLLYLQDPSTALSVRLLAPRPGEQVLDACAAPGGKSLLIADALAGASGGLVVAVDLPGPRLERLRENLGRVRGARAEAVGTSDFRRGMARLLRSRGLPGEYSAVLLDAPCTNTGVMRRRVDVRRRLRPEDFAKHARQQLGLLEAAARLVAPGGRLVYSTCSVDPEENEAVVEAFLGRSRGSFTPAGREIARPWEAGHDGAGAFLLTRATWRVPCSRGR